MGPRLNLTGICNKIAKIFTNTEISSDSLFKIGITLIGMNLLLKGGNYCIKTDPYKMYTFEFSGDNV